MLSMRVFVFILPMTGSLALPKKAERDVLGGQSRTVAMPERPIQHSGPSPGDPLAILVDNTKLLEKAPTQKSAGMPRKLKSEQRAMHCLPAFSSSTGGVQKYRVMKT
jgi:hypothetical protein